MQNGSIARGLSFLNRLTRWDPTFGRAALEAGTRHVAMVLRDLVLEQAAPVGRTSVAGRCETSERRGYHVVQASHDAREQTVSAPSRLVIRCRISGTRGEEFHAERPQGTPTWWALLAEATSWSDRV